MACRGWACNDVFTIEKGVYNSLKVNSPVFYVSILPAEEIYQKVKGGGALCADRAVPLAYQFLIQ